LAWTKAVMTKLGLTINEAKSSLKDARRESFDFLGYTIGPRHLPKGDDGILARVHRRRAYCGQDESQRAAEANNKGAWPIVRNKLNQLLVGCLRTSAMAPWLQL